MAKQFKSIEQIQNYAQNKIEDAMDEVYDFLLKKLIEIIKKDVYSNSSEGDYERSEDLLDPNNWEIKRYRRGGKIYRNLYFKEENFTTPSMGKDDFTHGNYLYGTFELNDFMRMLNGQTRDGGNPFNFPYLYELDRKPFWDDFLTYCDKNYDKLLKNAYRRNGLDVR